MIATKHVASFTAGDLVPEWLVTSEPRADIPRVLAAKPVLRFAYDCAVVEVGPVYWVLPTSFEPYEHFIRVEGGSWSRLLPPGGDVVFPMTFFRFQGEDNAALPNPPA